MGQDGLNMKKKYSLVPGSKLDADGNLIHAEDFKIGGKRNSDREMSKRDTVPGTSGFGVDKGGSKFREVDDLDPSKKMKLNNVEKDYESERKEIVTNEVQNKQEDEKKEKNAWEEEDDF